MCWFSEFSELVNLPISLSAAFDNASEVPVDFFLSFALSLFFVIEILEVVNASAPGLALVNQLQFAGAPF